MNYKIKRVILLISIIVSVISFIQNINWGYEAISVLPLAFGIAIQSIPDTMIFNSGLTMMFFVLCLRYLLYPLLFYYQPLEANIESFFIPAIIIMLLEIIVIFSTIKIYFKHHKIKHDFKNVHLNKMNGFMPFVFFLLMIFIYIDYPDVYANRHFILNSENINMEKIDISGGVSQWMTWGEFLVIFFLFNYFCIKYVQTQKRFYYLMSVLVLMFRCLFFVGHSRLSLLIPFVTVIFILKKVYDKKAKFTILLLIVYGVASTIILSIYKFFNTDSIDDIAMSLSPQGNAELINEYFGGVKNIMIGLNAYMQNGSSIVVWINDTFRNAMGISAIFEPDPRNSVTIFNLAAYQNLSYQGYDQICPTVIEGLLMFGEFLFFIPTVIMVYVCCHFDNLFHKTSSIERAYMYAYIATIIGWAIPGNYMHLCSNMFNSFIPMMILISLNKFFGTSRMEVKKTMQ